MIVLIISHFLTSVKFRRLESSSLSQDALVSDRLGKNPLKLPEKLLKHHHRLINARVWKNNTSGTDEQFAKGI